jgi:hypothetical protein
LRKCRRKVLIDQTAHLVAERRVASGIELAAGVCHGVLSNAEISSRQAEDALAGSSK